MTAAANLPGTFSRTRFGHRRVLLIAVFLGGALLAAGLGAYLWFRTSPAEVPSPAAVPDPPSIDQASDPAVAQLLAECRAAVGQSPRSAAAWGKLGMAFFVHDFPDEAQVCFAAAQRLDPLDARWCYFQGAIRAESDPEAAIQELEGAANLCADTPDAPRLQLAELLLAHGRLEKAAQQFQYLLRRSPANARAHLGLGRLAFLKGDLFQSQTHLGFSVRDRHTQKASHLLFAQIHERLGNKAIAEQEYRQAASSQDDPAWPDPYFEEAFKLQTGKKTFLIRANVLLEQGHLDACIAQCRKMAQGYPDSDTIWLILGKALLQKRDFAGAEEALNRALRLAPESIESQFSLGYAAFLQKDYHAATAWFRKLVELKPDFPMGYYHLGHCLIQLDDRSGAIEAFRATLRCQPDMADAHKLLGELLIKDGQVIAAIEHLRLAVQLRPTDAGTRQLFRQALDRLVIPIVL